MNVLVTLGSERLYSDLARKLSNRDPLETVTVIRLDKSGGCVDRSEDYMKTLRHAQIREYFFGHGENTLAPSSQASDFGDMTIFRIVESKDKPCQALRYAGADSLVAPVHSEYRSGDADEYDPTANGSNSIYECIPPSLAIQNSLVAITTASPTDSQEVIRDSSVKGYIYVADIDDVKKKVRLLSPQPGMIPGNAMVLGPWPEDVPGLVG